MRRILISIEYDGTNYVGWQRQQGLKSIQGEIEKALTKMFKKEILIDGVSRTDKGVHARNQKAVFLIDNNIANDKIPIALNSMIPQDIIVKDAIEVPIDFALRRSVDSKKYIYTIYNNQISSAIGKNFFWHCKGNLNIDAMNLAAEYLIGQHDFSAFKATGGSTKTSVRIIYECRLLKDGNYIYLHIKGNGFLYNMVRIIAGTLYEVGTGKTTLEQFKYILENKDRKLAGITAPPQGLCLEEIFFKNFQCFP
jgi:tRNA pseudouridine38-40 synthase